jgi:hypothetical protein
MVAGRPNDSIHYSRAKAVPQGLRGAGEEQRVTKGPNPQYANDWSRDGRFFIYQENAPGTQRDLWMLPFTPEGEVPGNAKPAPYLRTRFNENNARFSPEPSPRWATNPIRRGTMRYTSKVFRSGAMRFRFPQPAANTRSGARAGASCSTSRPITN